MTKQDKIEATLLAIRAIIETVRESGPMGAPRGPMYAAFMSHGCSLETFERLEALAVDSGIIERRGQTLHYVGARPQ